jgi:hypothetical protein
MSNKLGYYEFQKPLSEKYDVSTAEAYVEYVDAIVTDGTETPHRGRAMLSSLLGDQSLDMDSVRQVQALNYSDNDLTELGTADALNVLRAKDTIRTFLESSGLANIYKEAGQTLFFHGGLQFGRFFGCTSSIRSFGIKPMDTEMATRINTLEVLARYERQINKLWTKEGFRSQPKSNELLLPGPLFLNAFTENNIAQLALVVPHDFRFYARNLLAPITGQTMFESDEILFPTLRERTLEAVSADPLLTTTINFALRDVLEK